MWVTEGDAAAVDGAGGGVEEAAGSGVQGEVEDAAGAFEDGVGECRRRAVGLLAAGVGGGVDDVGVGLGGEGKVRMSPSSRVMAGSLAMCGELGAEGGGVAGEDGGLER